MRRLIAAALQELDALATAGGDARNKTRDDAIVFDSLVRLFDTFVLGTTR